MAKAAVEKATAISNAKIQFVSLVDKAANRRQFLLKKEQDGKATFTAYGRIVKADSENHYVTGVVYEPMTEDSHGNYMSEEEITKAAYYFAKNGDKVKKGDLLMEFDPEAIKAEGYDIITPVIVCNSGDYTVFQPHVGKTVKTGDEVITLSK